MRSYCVPRPLWLAAALLLLSACTTPQAPPAAQLPQLALAPAALGTELALAQRLTVTHEHGARTAPAPLEALLEVDAQSVRLVALALAQRVLTLEWDGQHLVSSRHALLPPQIQAAHVLRDVQLAYWPAAAVRAALPPGWTLEEGNRRRVLLAAGLPRVTIHYSNDPRWQGRVDIINLTESYRLTIESLPATSSAP